jgi:capsular polysaccharide transport system ATP-binding protein
MIRAVEVCKDYRTEARVDRVLSDVSFTVERGEKVTVLGRNVAGRSTLMGLLGGVGAHHGKLKRTIIVLAAGPAGRFPGEPHRQRQSAFIARIYNKRLRLYPRLFDDFAKLVSTCRSW